jgi:hypothetical protein
VAKDPCRASRTKVLLCAGAQTPAAALRLFDRRGQCYGSHHYYGRRYIFSFFFSTPSPRIVTYIPRTVDGSLDDGQLRDYVFLFRRSTSLDVKRFLPVMKSSCAVLSAECLGLILFVLYYFGWPIINPNVLLYFSRVHNFISSTVYPYYIYIYIYIYIYRERERYSIAVRRALRCA